MTAEIIDLYDHRARRDEGDRARERRLWRAYQEACYRNWHHPTRANRLAALDAHRAWEKAFARVGG